MAFTLIGSAAFVLIGIVMLLDPSLLSSREALFPLLRIVGLIAVVVFGFFGFLGLRMLTRPILVIDDAGIHDNTSGMSVGFIPWEQATGFFPTPFQTVGVTNDFVSVIWADPGYPMRTAGPIARFLIRSNARFNVPPGVISADVLPMTGEELALLLLAQRRARRPELPEAPGMPATAPLS